MNKPMRVPPRTPPKLRSIDESLELAAIVESAPMERLGTENTERAEARALLIKGVMSDFSDTEIEKDIDALIDARSAIYNHVREIEGHFLDIGKALIDLSSKISAKLWDRVLGDYDRKEEERASGEAVFPFSRWTAQRLMNVRLAVDKRVFHEAFLSARRTFDVGLLPPYSISAMFATLDQPQLVKVVEADLFRPDVSARQVQSFLSSLRPARQANVGAGHRELKKTDDKIAKLVSELHKLQAKRSEILAALGMPDTGATLHSGDRATPKGRILDMRPTARDGVPTGGGEGEAA